MKYLMLFFLLNIFCLEAFCQNKAKSGMYEIADSIRATAYYAEIKMTEMGRPKYKTGGIIANKALLGLDYFKEQRLILFGFFDSKKNYVEFGKGTYSNGPNYAWNYNWQYDETYSLLIATASDSASNKTLYSGYIYLPNEKKWKLIATRSYDDTLTIKFISNVKKPFMLLSNRWLQLSNGSWKALDSQTTKPPSLRQMSNIDSLAQQKMEEDLLRSKLSKDSVVYEEGMFYQTLTAGTGRFVKVTDTLTVHYRGSLYTNGSVFDETKNKPATIPPNSILVFDVEVLDAKEKIIK
jgi:FKBP-type peptidyl-prolyl cis-trans isomerase FkpA